MKNFLYVHFSKYRIVRRYLGGRWAKDRSGGEWVWFDELKDRLALAIAWPLNPNEYMMEDYRYWGRLAHEAEPKRGVE